MTETVRFYDRISARHLVQHYDTETGALVRAECRTCRDVLPANRFRPDSRRKSSRRHICRSCARGRSNLATWSMLRSS